MQSLAFCPEDYRFLNVSRLQKNRRPLLTLKASLSYHVGQVHYTEYPLHY
jgi:hypothetical protein